MPEKKLVKVNGRNLALTNLEKVLWPDEGITKAEVIKYYADFSKYVLAFVKDRPLMTQRYPNGINEEYFVQKHFPQRKPQRWQQTVTCTIWRLSSSGVFLSFNTSQHQAFKGKPKDSTRGFVLETSHTRAATVLSLPFCQYVESGDSHHSASR